MRSSAVTRIFWSAVVCAFCTRMQAQTTIQSNTDGVIAAAIEGGNPASSYALGIDHVNFYNGKLNVTIPLVHIGGRGTAGYTMVVPIGTQWSVQSIQGYGNVAYAAAPSFGGTAASNLYEYSPGGLTISYASDFPGACQDDNGNYYDEGTYATRLIWTAPDGTDTTLVDTRYGGQALDGFCNTSPRDRGQVFASTDGSSLTFIADQDIYDYNGETGGGSTVGTLYFRDGTKYRIDYGGRVTQIEDRNGNLVQLTYGTDNATLSIVDPLGRTTSVLTGSGQAAITYPGANGTQHTIIVNYTDISNALSAGQSIETYGCLFPELDGSKYTNLSLEVVSSIVLANGHSYNFQYNSYGEVSRLQLPTGGVYQYTFPEAQGCAANTGSGVIPTYAPSGYSIYRRMGERDEYSDGANLSAKTIFPVPQYGNVGPNNAWGTNAEADYEDASGNLLRRENHFFYGDPSSGSSIPGSPTQYESWMDGIEFQTIIGDANTTWRTMQNVWMQRPCSQNEACWFDPQFGGSPAHDPQLCQTNTTLDNGLTSGLVWTYDQYNNQTAQYEFDFGAAPAIGSSCPSSPGGYARRTQTQYAGSPYTDNHLLGVPLLKTIDAGGAAVAETHYGWDETSISDAPGIVGHDGNYGTSFTVRGNLTNPAQCVNPAANCPVWINHASTYDIAGNVTTSQDGNSNYTWIGYNDDGANKYAFPTSVTNAAGQTTRFWYDYGAGKRYYSTDANGVNTWYSFTDWWNGQTDPLDRVAVIAQAYGTASEAHTLFDYSNSPAFVDQYQDQNTTGDSALHSRTVYDGLGRAVESDTFEGGSQYIATTQTYDALGRLASAMTPAHPGSGMNYATTYSYDGLGRATRVQTADGAVATNSYWGNYTTAIDAAGKARVTGADGLGRIVGVWEDPNGSNYPTGYGYDALDDLTVVSQSGQSRTFVYDAVGRLTQATNPESGTTGYGYDGNGNVTTKTDARSVTTSYRYDALNRLYAKSYSDGTPAVSYTYDTPGISNSVGRLTQVSNSAATTNYTGYDASGRITSSNEQTAGQTYSFSYGYNLAGAPTSETYPSGRVVTTIFDAANRPSTLTGTVNGQQTGYITQTAYWAHGGVYYFVRGNGVWHAVSYNSRLQQTESYESAGNQLGGMLFVSCPNWGVNSNAGLYDICPHASQTNDNGNLQSYSEFNNGVGWFSQSVSYDGVNRLTAASDSGGWSRSFGYDAWGNMSVTGNNGVPLYGTTPYSSNGYNPYNSGSNRLLSGGYDAAGNQTALGSISVQYDAESRQNQTNDSNSQLQVNYYYDGEGQRVQKNVYGGAASVYVYDAFGQLAAEYAPAAALSKDYIRFGGQIAAVENAAGAPCQTCYLSYDHLGTPRLVTDQYGNVIARHDYLPFGEEIPAGWAGRSSQWGAGTDNVSQKFTGQERDPETGLDFFRARYFAGVQGRFNSPDPMNAGADLTNPQSWNGYSYVWNNPLGAVDPDGMGPLGYQYKDLQNPAQVPWSQAWFSVNFGGGGSCSIDGVDVQCGMLGNFSRDSMAQCPDNGCTGVSGGQYYQFSSYAGGLSGYVPSGLQPYRIQDTLLGQTYTSYGNIILASAPQDGNGNPLPPPVALPPGGNGQPNVWVPAPGSGARVKWKPFVPVPSPKGAQPQASWDPSGHWDVDWGNKVRERYLPNGTKVGHFNNPIPFVAAGAGAAGAAVGFSIPTILEWLGLGLAFAF